MDPATIATIAGLTGAAKTTVETVRLILEKAKGRDAEKAAKEALGLVMELNTRLLQLQEIAFRLHEEKAQAVEENTQLRKEIRHKEEWVAEGKKYKGKKVGHSLFLVHEDDPDLFYCPTCFRTKQALITVQPYSGRYAPIGSIGGYQCNSCGTRFPTTSPPTLS